MMLLGRKASAAPLAPAEPLTPYVPPVRPAAAKPAAASPVVTLPSILQPTFAQATPASPAGSQDVLYWPTSSTVPTSANPLHVPGFYEMPGAAPVPRPAGIESSVLQQSVDPNLIPGFDDWGLAASPDFTQG